MLYNKGMLIRDPEYDVEYMVVERRDKSQDKYALFLDEDISIGDIIRLRPDYHGGSPWGFDHPVQVDAVRVSDGKVVAKMRTLGVFLHFNTDPRERRASYFIAEPEKGEAILSGVPIEDVFV